MANTLHTRDKKRKEKQTKQNKQTVESQWARSKPNIRHQPTKEKFRSGPSLRRDATACRASNENSIAIGHDWVDNSP